MCYLILLNALYLAFQFGSEPSNAWLRNLLLTYIGKWKCDGKSQGTDIHMTLEKRGSLLANLLCWIFCWGVGWESVTPAIGRVTFHSGNSQLALIVCFWMKFSTASDWKRIQPEVSLMTGIFWASIQRSSVLVVICNLAATCSLVRRAPSVGVDCFFIFAMSSGANMTTVPRCNTPKNFDT